MNNNKQKLKKIVISTSILGPALIAAFIAIPFITKKQTPVVEDKLINTINKNLKALDKQIYKGQSFKERLDLLKAKGVDLENKEPEVENSEFLYDYAKNRVIAVTYSEDEGTDIKVSEIPDENLYDETTKVGDPITKSANFWRFVGNHQVSSYSRLSQYLKGSEAFDQKSYVVKGGFDAGSHKEITDVTYNYDKDDTSSNYKGQTIVITTVSAKTNVTVHAFEGSEANAVIGDEVYHNGVMGEFVITSAYKVTEFGQALHTTVSSKSDITVEAGGRLEMVYVASTGVKLSKVAAKGTLPAGYYKVYVSKSLPEHDKISAEQIEQAKAQGADCETEKDDEGIITDQKKVYEDYSKEKPEEEQVTVVPTFSVLDSEGKETDLTFDTLTALSKYSNDKEKGDARFFENKTIVLNKNYDMSIESKTWQPICAAVTDEKKVYDKQSAWQQIAFKGTFDGNGHTITNLNLNNQGATERSMMELAFFGGLSGNVKNLTFKDCSNTSYVMETGHTTGYKRITSGMLACAIGNQNTPITIDNVNFENSNITAEWKTGFLAGFAEFSKEINIKNVYVDDKCEMETHAYAEELEEKDDNISSSTGSLIAHVYNVTTLNFENTTNSGGVDGINATSGFVGMYELGTTLSFNNCTNNGAVYNRETRANDQDGFKVAGFIASMLNLNTNFDIKFKGCINNGKIYTNKVQPAKWEQSRSADFAGGFIAYLGGGTTISKNHIIFEDCQNNGDVTIDCNPLGNTEQGAAGFIGRVELVEDNQIEFNVCNSNGSYRSLENAGYFASIRGGLGTDPEITTCVCKLCVIGENAKIPEGPTLITRCVGEPAPPPAQ